MERTIFNETKSFETPITTRLERAKKIFNGKLILTFKDDAQGYLFYEELEQKLLLPSLFLFQKDNKQRYDIYLKLNPEEDITAQGKFLLKEDWIDHLKKYSKHGKIINEEQYAIRFNEKTNEIILSNIPKKQISDASSILMDKLNNFVTKKLTPEQKERLDKFVMTPKEDEYVLMNKLSSANPKAFPLEFLKQMSFDASWGAGGLSIPKKADPSKTLYEAIDRGAILEGIEITDYTREQLAQKMVEIIQDAFKDYKEKWRIKKLEDKDVTAFIDNHFVRQREYQRWTDDELKNLWHLWKYECKRIPDIARLMQRTEQACDKMIDFIEKYGQKYQNLDNHYKRIITKAGVIS